MPTFKKDPKEQINIANGNKIEREGWRALINWSTKETKRRSKEDWLWRNLIS